MFDGHINAAAKHTSDFNVTVRVKQRSSERHVYSTAGLVTEVCGKFSLTHLEMNFTETLKWSNCSGSVCNTSVQSECFRGSNIRVRRLLWY